MTIQNCSKFVIGSAAALLSLAAMPGTAQASLYPDCPGALGFDVDGYHGITTSEAIMGQIIWSMPSPLDDWFQWFDASYLNHKKDLPGFEGPGAINTIYGKWSNAAFITQYAIDVTHIDDEIDVFGRPWHGDWDYMRLAKARRTQSHYEYTYFFDGTTPADGTIGLHEYRYRTYGVLDSLGLGSRYESVTLFCPLLSEVVAPTTSHPVARAAAMVHEGQHAWGVRYPIPSDNEWSFDFLVGAPHEKCQPGDYDCDTYRPHTRAAVKDKELWKHIEFPYQVEMEFECDVADYPNSWVPKDFQEVAEQWAGNRQKYKFRNKDALPACGNPFPFGRRSAEKPDCWNYLGIGYCGCSNGLTMCGEVCVDLTVNHDNCGFCGNSCTTDQICQSGTCGQNACRYGTCADSSDCGGAPCNEIGCCVGPPIR